MRCRTSGSSASWTISWISFLPPSSAGCALPAMTSWIGRSGCEQQPLEALGVAQHQREPLVRRRRGARSRSSGRRGRGRRRSSRARPSRRHASPTSGPAACGRRRRAARAAARLTAQISAAGTLSTAAQNPVGVVGVGVGALARGELDDLAGDPGRRVDAVGDRADRDLGLVEGRPQAVEHAAADLAVQHGDAVGALGEAEAHHGHVEDRGVAAVVVLGAEGEDPLDRDARGGAGVAEVLLDEGPREAVDAGRAPGCGW